LRQEVPGTCCGLGGRCANRDVDGRGITLRHLVRGSIRALFCV
jgi:hypothetical protein